MVRKPPANAEGKRWGVDPWVGKIPAGRKWQPAPVFLPGKFHGQRSLVGYNLRGCKELDRTEHAHPPTPTPGSILTVSIVFCFFRNAIWYVAFSD